MQKSSAKLKLGHPQRRPKCRWGGLKCRCGSWKLATFDAKRC